jgi:hypothetical protein
VALAARDAGVLLGTAITLTCRWTKSDCQLWQSIISAIRPSVLYRDILALDVTEITETLLKWGHELRIGKPTVDNSSYRCRLLRPRRERPRRSAAKEGDKLTTLQSMEMHPLPWSTTAA